MTHRTPDCHYQTAFDQCRSAPIADALRESLAIRFGAEMVRDLNRLQRRAE